MINFLSRIFVKDYKNVESPKVRHRYGMFVSVVGLVLNVCLFVMKYIVGLLFGSIAIKADAINNFFDTCTTVIGIIGFKICAKPADRGHPYGHARFEYIASMIVSFVVFHFGLDLITESVQKIISNETKTTFGILAVIVLSISIVVKLFMYVLNKKIGKKVNSAIMRAVARDSLSDVIATSGVLISTLVLYFARIDIDAYLGIIIAVIILYNGFKAFNETKDSILGEAPNKSLIAKVRKIIAKYPEALGAHDLYFHNYGAGRSFMSMHIEVDGSKDIFKTHDIIDNIEKEIHEELLIKCTVHMDPIVTDDKVINALRKSASKKIAEIDERLHIHDFRFVYGETHSNLIFDIVAPFEFDICDEDLIEKAEQKIKEIDSTYNSYITIDRE